MSFPASPSVGDETTQGGRTYTWSGYAWDLVGNVESHVHSGADITSGTVADARLSTTAQNAVALHPFLLMGG